MKNIPCKALAWHALNLSLIIGLASRAYGDTITGTAVNLDTNGNFTGTGVPPDAPQLDPAVQGTHADHDVTATYSLSTTTNAQGKVVLDDTKTNTITLKDTGDGFTTPPIKITNITVDNQGKVTGFEFKGTDWYDPNSTKAKDVTATSIHGSITFTRNPKLAKGSLTASYDINGSKTVQNISFTTNPVPQSTKVKTDKAGAPIASESTIPDTKSLDYDAATGILSIRDDTITQTPAANDPILGASLTFPDFQYEGLSRDGSVAVFWPTNSTPYLMAQGGNIYQRSVIPFLLYETASNQFFGGLSNTALAGVPSDSPFYDATLANISSPFLLSLDDIMNPSSVNFDPEANLYLSITADVNFKTLTNNFTTSGVTGATDVQIAADPIPEPTTFVLLGIGCCGLLAYPWLRRTQR